MPETPPIQTDRLGDQLPQQAVQRLGTHRLRHAAAVTAVAYTPAGDRLISASQDGEICVWRAPDYECIRRTHVDGIVRALTVSPDSRTVCVAFGDLPPAAAKQPPHILDAVCNVHCYSLDDWLPLRIIENCGLFIKYSPRGDLMAIGTLSGNVALVDPKTGKIGRYLRGTTYCAAFTKDGKHLITGGAQGTVKIWDLRTADVLHEFSSELLIEPGWGISDVDVSPDGSVICFCSAAPNEGLHFWDVNFESETDVIEVHDGHAITRAQFTPKGDGVVYTSRDGRVRLADLSARACLPFVSQHYDEILDAAFAPKAIATAGRDQCIHVWDISHRKPARQFAGHHQAVDALCFSPDGSRVLSQSKGDKNRKLPMRSCLWSVPQGDCLLPIEDDADLSTYAFSSDGRYMVHCYDGNQMIIRYAETGQRARLLDSELTVVRSIKVSPNDDYVVASDGERLIQGWDLKTGAVRFVRDVESSQCHDLAFHPELGLVAAISENLRQQRIDVLAVFKRQRLCAIDWPYYADSIVLAPDGRHVMLGYDTNDQTPSRRALAICQTSDGQAVATRSWQLDQAYQFLFSPDGRRAVFGLSGEHIMLYDLPGAEGRDLLRIPLQRPSTLSWMNERVLCFAYDRDVWVWDVQSNEQLNRFIGHRGDVLSVAGASNGQFIASTSTDATVLIWPGSPSKGG